MTPTERKIALSCQCLLTALDNVEAFRILCENNVDVGVSVHGLRFYGETPKFKALIDKYPAIYSKESAVAQDVLDEYTAYFKAQANAATELLKVADNGNELLTEIREWVVALGIQAYQGLDIVKMATALKNNTPADFIDAYRRYTSWAEKAFNNVSRDFPGSIQSVRVQTGTLYVAPWIKSTAADLADVFKKSGAEYPEDLFPKQVLENGSYYIKHEGRILGNPNAGSIGGKPVFQTEIDDINPNRQEWVIKLDAITGRYEIRNSKDDRYLNELTNFGVNPYSADWNTYVITKNEEGKYAIQNAGSGGDAFWGVEGDRLITGAGKDARYVFEIIPVAE